MGKNNYILDYEKRIAEMRKRVRLDTAYIGAGLAITMQRKGYGDDAIIELIEANNALWVELAESGVNPIKYCFEQTGIQIMPEDAETINGYFEEE